MMATHSDNAGEKINQTLINLADGPGYSVRKLLDTPMLELLPTAWGQLKRAAACDELIREYAPRISRDNHAAAVQAALNLQNDYETSKLRSRLVEFRRRWHSENPSFPLKIDLADDIRTWDSTRKWWDAGKEMLVKFLATEIRRRDQTKWPEPSREASDRIKAALRPDEEQPSDEAAAHEEQKPVPASDQGHRHRRLPVRLRATAIILLVLVIGALVWFVNRNKPQTADTHNTKDANMPVATCADVGDDGRGVLDPTWAGPFRAAYQEAGGKAALGCPRTDDPSGYVHQWGAGTSQDLQGGRAGIARIMAISPQHVIIMAGPYWHDYTDLGNGQPDSNAAQEKGYPTSNPVACGPARLVLLEYSQQHETPGALVTSARSEHFIWLPKSIWLAYKENGGPLGPLGQPIGQEQPIPSGIRQQFEHGSISVIGVVVHTDISGPDRAGNANTTATTLLGKCLARAGA
jgi:hypothetical protein